MCCDRHHQTNKSHYESPEQFIVASNISRTQQKKEHKLKNTRFEGGEGENLNNLRSNTGVYKSL